ncbi:MAG: type II secretion system F family protein, partial [Bacillota bacterium]|nr:type II secretion system F family protein [Bacillota bacterium]
MKRYAYTGRSRGGRTVRGFVQAETEAAAAVQVREQGYLVTSIKVAKESKPLFKRRPKLKAKNLGIFCRQFAIMLNTGLTLVQALELLESQSDDQAFAEVLHDIRLEVASGVAFTKTLEKNRDVFPHVFIHLV